MNRKIVFVNQATGYLTIDIINEFAKEFEKVALIAGSIRIQDVPLSESVEWIKITKYNRGNPKKKFFSWIWGTIQIFFILMTRFRKYEIFYITVPPTAYLISLILPNRFSILIADVFPDALKIINIKESAFIYRLWHKCNLKLFSRAHRLFTLGESMRKALSAYIEEDKIIVLNNWTGLTKLNPIPKENNPFIKRNKLEGKFIVEYSGNIGITHNVETILEVAEKILDFPEICFLIIGRGDRYNNINELIKSRKLHNCKLLPFQPDNELKYSLSAADISVVILNEKVATSSIPSKIYNLLAVGCPIMVIGSENTDLAEFVEENHIGKSFISKEVEEMISFIIELYENHKLLNEYSNNALNISKDYTCQNAQIYLEKYLK